MTNKKNKQRKRQAASSDAAAGNEGSSSPSTDAGDFNRSGQSPEASTSPPLPTTEPAQEDPIVLAEKTKERGNVAFKEKRFAEAVELYTSAIGASFSSLFPSCRAQFTEYTYDFPTTMLQLRRSEPE